MEMNQDSSGKITTTRKHKGCNLSQDMVKPAAETNHRCLPWSSVTMKPRHNPFWASQRLSPGFIVKFTAFPKQPWCFPLLLISPRSFRMLNRGTPCYFGLGWIWLNSYRGLAPDPRHSLSPRRFCCVRLRSHTSLECFYRGNYLNLSCNCLYRIWEIFWGYLSLWFIMICARFPLIWAIRERLGPN